MKLFLLVFLAGCAVKCDESNYYVVQMPESDVAQEQLPLQVYWNVPTMQCTSKKIPFRNLERFGIIQNENDTFRGDKISILYDPGIFPALLYNTSTNELKFRNGGVPQEGDLGLHYKMFRSVLSQSIPDKDFSGIGIIDFESWRPILRQNFGEVYPYKRISYDIERKKHWLWPTAWVQDEAKQRFEEAARRFMQNTIAIAKKMRPHARWGYYGFPYCFNMAGSTMAEDCAANVKEENDQLDWLWLESTALYPSVYSSAQLSGSQLRQLIRGRVREAARLQRGEPILPYFWFRYRDGGFMEEEDLQIALNTFNQSEANGFIIWGSSKDVNTPEKCKNLLSYVENVLGPAIRKYTESNDYVDLSSSKDIYNKQHEDILIEEEKVQERTTTESLIAVTDAFEEENSTVNTNLNYHLFNLLTLLNTNAINESISNSIHQLNHTFTNEDYLKTSGKWIDDNGLLGLTNTSTPHALNTTNFDYQNDTNIDLTMLESLKNMLVWNKTESITPVSEPKHQNYTNNKTLLFDFLKDTVEPSFGEKEITVTEPPKITEGLLNFEDKNIEDKSNLTYTEIIKKYDFKNNTSNELTKDFMKSTLKVRDKINIKDHIKRTFDESEDSIVDYYESEYTSTKLPALSKEGIESTTKPTNVLFNNSFEDTASSTASYDTIGNNEFKKYTTNYVLEELTSENESSLSKTQDILIDIDNNTVSDTRVSENNTTISKDSKKGKFSVKHRDNIVDLIDVIYDLYRILINTSNIELKTGKGFLTNYTNISKEEHNVTELLEHVCNMRPKIENENITIHVISTTEPTLINKSKNNSTASKNSKKGKLKDKIHEHFVDLLEVIECLYKVVNDTANTELESGSDSLTLINSNKSKEEHNNTEVSKEDNNNKTLKETTDTHFTTLANSTLTNKSKNNSTASKDSKKGKPNKINNNSEGIYNGIQIENHNKIFENSTKKELDNIKTKELKEESENAEINSSLLFKTANEMEQNITNIQVTTEVSSKSTSDQVLVYIK